MNIVSVKLSYIILTEVTGIHNVSRAVPEIEQHSIAAVYDINQADSHINVSIMVAYLCNGHLGGIFKPSTVDQLPTAPMPP